MRTLPITDIHFVHRKIRFVANRIRLIDDVYSRDGRTIVSISLRTWSLNNDQTTATAGSEDEPSAIT